MLGIKIQYCFVNLCQKSPFAKKFLNIESAPPTNHRPQYELYNVCKPKINSSLCKNEINTSSRGGATKTLRCVTTPYAPTCRSTAV